MKVLYQTAQNTMKKALREMQTMRPGYSKVQPKNFALPQIPFPSMQDGRNLISWRWSLPSPTDPVWSRSMHAISSYRGNGHIHKQTGLITIHCIAKLSAQCNHKKSRLRQRTDRQTALGLVAFYDIWVYFLSHMGPVTRAHTGGGHLPR